MSAARNYGNLQPATRETGRPRRVVRRVERTPKKSWYNLRLFLIGGSVSVFSLLFLQLWLDSQITAIYVEAQGIQRSIQVQAEANAQLQSEIRELSSYTRVMEVAVDYGLEIQENNIIFAD